MRECVDIDDELDRLVIQYGIDRYHPRFAKKRNAKLLMETFWNEYKNEKVILVAASLTDSNYIQEDCALHNRIKDVVLYEQIENYSWETKRDVSVVIVSFYGRREVASYLYRKRIKARSVYDYLAEHGLVLESNYYDIFGEEYCTYWENKVTFDYDALDMNAIFFYDRRRYEIAESEPEKEMYLARMIFDCVYVKDWELVERYIKEYSEAGGFSCIKQYEEFLGEIKELINSIKESLAAREKNDIVMFWLDELEFGEDTDMPYLYSLSEKSVDFLNAYTVTPYTNSTAKTLFAKQCVVDDRAYKIRVSKECSFIRNMEERGFQFRFYTFLTQVDNEIKGRICQKRLTTFSEMCWDMISDMLKSKEKMFAVLHEVYATHFPYISLGLSGDDYLFFREKSRVLTDYEKALSNRQMLESRKYVDSMLRQYCALMPDNIYKIFMSDHGHTELDKYHTIFRIVHQDIIPQKIEKIFSYINFDKLIYKMLNNETDYDEITGEYAQIQDVDYYEKNTIKKYLNNLNLLLTTDAFLWGWKGVVTRRHIYIRYNDGRERYYNNLCYNAMLTDENVEYLRNLCTPYPLDIIHDEKFRYSRNAYKTLQNYMKRNGQRETEKKQAIVELFARFSRGKRVALRGGGEHTLRLWYILKEEQQEPISCVIDENKNCKASRLGLKIIDVHDIHQEKIDVIVISSYQKEIEWYEELRKCARNIQIIGLYDYLKEKGINCEREFYKKEYAKEDIVWEE